MSRSVSCPSKGDEEREGGIEKIGEWVHEAGRECKISRVGFCGAEVSVERPGVVESFNSLTFRIRFGKTDMVNVCAWD